MHLKDDQLRAYIDQELPAGRERQAGEHLQRCAECRTRLDHLRSIQQQVHARLDRLSPTPNERPRTAGQAYARFAFNKPSIQSQNMRENSMLRKKSLWTALAILTAFVLVFTITPARAWASTFLNLFRVQQVQVITFDPSAIDGIHGQMEANRAVFEQIFEEDLEISDYEPDRPVGSVGEAAQAAGFTPRVPTAVENAEISIQPGMQAVLTIDQPKLNELASLVGVDLALPESLDGQAVRVSMPTAVVFSSNCDANAQDERPDPDCLRVVQIPSPSVDAPDGLDLERMGAALFQVLGYSEADAARLSQTIDWTSTLVLPIPVSDEVGYQEVSVDGVTGTLLTEDNEAALIWIKNGMLYAVNAPDGADQAVAIAESLE